MNVLVLQQYVFYLFIFLSIFLWIFWVVKVVEAFLTLKLCDSEFNL